MDKKILAHIDRLRARLAINLKYHRTRVYLVLRNLNFLYLLLVLLGITSVISPLTATVLLVDALILLSYFLLDNQLKTEPLKELVTRHQDRLYYLTKMFDLVYIPLLLVANLTRHELLQMYTNSQEYFFLFLCLNLSSIATYWLVEPIPDRLISFLKKILLFLIFILLLSTLPLTRQYAYLFIPIRSQITITATTLTVLLFFLTKAGGKIMHLLSFFGKNDQAKRYLTALFLTTIVFIGGSLRFINLGKDALYHDESTQYAAVQGVIEHGQSAIFNPITGKKQQDYPRARILNYITARLVKSFGDSEFVIRFPVALMGTLLIPVFYLSTYRLISKPFALYGTLLIAFNPYLIYLSRFFRNYSPLIFFFFISTVFLTRIIGKILRGMLFHPSILDELIPALIFIYLTNQFGYIYTRLLIGFFGIFTYIMMLATYKKTSDYYSRWALILPPIIALAVVIADFSGVYPKIGIRFIIKNHLNLASFTQAPNGAKYLHYLLPYHFNKLLYLLLPLSGAVLFVKKKISPIFPIALTALGYYAVAYLGQRYEDFRYISFLVPVAILSVSTGFDTFYQLIRKIPYLNLRLAAGAAAAAIMFLLPTYFVPFRLPTSPAYAKYLGLGQPWWTANEGASYIHRRAVAPETKKAMAYVNDNMENDPDQDIIISSGIGRKYLKSHLDKVFYVNRDSLYLESADGTRRIHYQDFLKKYRCFDIWFISTYIHLLDHHLVNTILQDPQTIPIGTQIGIKKFEYNDFYFNKDVTWPTVIKIESSCDHSHP